MSEQVKPMSKTEIRKQAKSNEDVIKHIILKNLKKEGFKVVPDTFKLSRKGFVKSMSVGQVFSMDYVVDLESKDGLSGLEIGGDFQFPIGELKKGDAIFAKKKCNVPVHSGFEVNCYMGYCERNWK